jgi:aldehyde dehydrogenase (NAD+)
MAAAAPTLTPVTLELGGKSPVIVTSDADLDVAARRIAMIKLLNSGQTCIAPDYVLVERSVRTELVDRIVATLARFRRDSRGKGLPIVNDRQFDRLTGYLKATRGTVTTAGPPDRESLTMHPAVVVNPDPDEPVMSSEIFGPILPVIEVADVDEAIRFVRNRPKPLALYVFAGSQSRARRIVDAAPAGGAVINHVAMHCLVPQLPFGGVGPSGMGAYHGEWGFQQLSHRKAVLSKATRPDLKLLYPPYTRRALAVMRQLF